MQLSDWLLTDTPFLPQNVEPSRGLLRCVAVAAKADCGRATRRTVLRVEALSQGMSVMLRESALAGGASGSLLHRGTACISLWEIWSSVFCMQIRTCLLRDGML